MQNNIIIINGPNINLLGDRDKSIYGSESYEDLIKNCTSEASKKNINIDYYQSNIEGELVTKIQESRKIYDGMIVKGRIENLLDDQYEEVFGFQSQGLGIYLGIGSEF